MDVENKYIPQSIRIYNDIILNKKIVFIGKKLKKCKWRREERDREQERERRERKREHELLQMDGRE